MKYNQDMFLEDFKDCYSLEYSSFSDYEYFVALEDILKFKGWQGHELKQFRARRVKTGEIIWIQSCNSHNEVSQNEIFIGAIYKSPYRHSVSVCRGTGVFTFTRKRRVSRTLRMRIEANRIRFKKERPLYYWFDKERDRIFKEIQSIYKKMDSNLSKYQPREVNPNFNKYIINTAGKRIKTAYGIKINAYESRFELDIDLCKIKVHQSYTSLVNISNIEEFKGANLPLYEIKHNGITYLLEESDLIKQHKGITETVFNHPPSKWEEDILNKEKELRMHKKWLHRCLDNIEREVSLKYTVP